MGQTQNVEFFIFWPWSLILTKGNAIPGEIETPSNGRGQLSFFSALPSGATLPWFCVAIIIRLVCYRWIRMSSRSPVIPPARSFISRPDSKLSQDGIHSTLPISQLVHPPFSSTSFSDLSHQWDDVLFDCKFYHTKVHNNCIIMIHCRWRGEYRRGHQRG